MRSLLTTTTLLALCGWSGLPLHAALPQPLVSGLKNPESVVLGPGGFYVTEIGEFDKDGDGQVTLVKDGQATPFAKGLNDPKGIALYANESLFVTDKNTVLKINLKGEVTKFAPPEAFPTPPKFLNDVVVEPETGSLYVSDSGDLMGKAGAVYRIDIKTGKVSLVLDAEKLPGLHTPNGLAMDGVSHLLVLDFGSGVLTRVRLSDLKAEKVAEGFDGGDGLTWDWFGRLYVTSWKLGSVWGIPRPGEKPVLLTKDFEQAADSCLAADGKQLVVPDMKGGSLTVLPVSIPGWEVDETPLAIGLEPAFPKLEWTGWSPETENGLPNPLRPILLTHAGDGSNRIFAPLQQGTIHVFPNEKNVAATKVFLDISKKVRYLDRQNEEGLLGLAFHPKFKTNGEFFVFYTDVKAEMANVVSRFRVSKTDPNKADPTFQEELIRFEKPFWNHDGGTIAFGPDGYLYITHGDGGAGGDPHANGQKLSTLLGKVLRIDVDKKANGKNYAIPKDNPFVGKEGVAPEIWAYGLRNVWRMAFDKKTGQLWAGEVGQNLYEEINIFKAGGNYGWKLRESLHPFSDKGVSQNKEMIDPIWEYHHDLGKSITGGFVYRGKSLPEIDGMYLYADYVSARIWALKYDDKAGRVTANREIKSQNLPIPSFGEDEMGEAYILIHSGQGKGIFRLVKLDPNKTAAN